MYSESGIVPSPSLFQNHVITGVTSFEVYVSDVIERRFEKVKNGHIFENWTPIWRLDVDLSLNIYRNEHWWVNRVNDFWLSLKIVWGVVICIGRCWLVWFIVINATFNNILAISWRSVLSVEETGAFVQNHRPVANHC